MYLSSSVLFPGSEEGIQTKTKYLKATFYISFALYLDIFTQRFILCLVLFCLMLNEDLYFVALKIYVRFTTQPLSGFSLPDPPRGRGQPLDGGLPSRLRLQGEGGARRVPGLPQPGGHGQQQTYQLRGK